MPFFKLRHRTKSSPAPTVSISKPLPSSPDSNLPLSSEHFPPPNSMDNANRGTPPTPLKLRGNYQPVNTAAPLRRIPSSPLPSLPSYESGDDLGSPNGLGGTDSGYARGIAKFERVRTESEDTANMLSPTKSPLDRISSDIDELTQFVPTSLSPPKLRLSFESNITEAGSVYDMDTPINHRVSLKTAFKKPTPSAVRQSLPERRSPERIITSPVKITPQTLTNTDSRSRPRTSSNGPALRRSSALYKRPSSNDSTSIKSGNSHPENPEDRDSGFHEDFDEALRSKPPSPDKQVFDSQLNNNPLHQRDLTANSDRMVITPERAPLIPSEGRITPITLTDPGVTAKPTPMSLPQIERMETFKETFSTNLFENTISPDAKRSVLLNPKPIISAAKGKVLTPAEFEKLRQQAEDDSEDEEEEEDVARDETYQIDLAKQRQRQQAALSIYRQQMTKVVGATASSVSIPDRPASRFGGIPEVDDEADEIPLAILMAHGFPQTNSRPSSSQSRDRSVSLDAKRTPSPGNLPVFAKNLPSDPHAKGLPRMSSAQELRPASSASFGGYTIGRTASTPSIPLLDTYHTRQRKGASFLDPNTVFNSHTQALGPEQSYFSQIPGQYNMMGMQPIHNQGVIQYVPVMVSPPIGSPMDSPAGSPILTPMQTPTLMHEIQNRQQYGIQQRQRMSQYAPQIPPHAHPVQRFPQAIQSRPQSIYPTSRQSVYDQKSLYSLSSQQPTPRPKLPSTNPAYRLSSISNSSQPGRYRASTYGNSALGVTPKLQVSASDDDEGWEALKRKKEQMQARRMTRLQAA